METWHTAPAPHQPRMSLQFLGGRARWTVPGHLHQQSQPAGPGGAGEGESAPKNAARARNQLFTNAPSVTPVRPSARDELDLSVDGRRYALARGDGPGARHSCRPRSRACGDRHDRAPRRRGRAHAGAAHRSRREGISSRRHCSSRGCCVSSIRSPSNSSRLTSRRNGMGRCVRRNSPRGGDAHRVGLAEVVARIAAMLAVVGPGPTVAPRAQRDRARRSSFRFLLPMVVTGRPT